MSRLKLSEFRSKTILYDALGETYDGISLNTSLFDEAAIKTFFSNHQTAVLKVDQAIKKRNKLGLVDLDLNKDNVQASIEKFKSMGYTWLLLEPFLAHEQTDERYLSIELTNEGVSLLHSARGGIEIEAHPETIQSATVGHDSELKNSAVADLSDDEITRLLRVFNEQSFTNLEVNPYVRKDNKVYLLDAAVEVDGSAEFFSDKWSRDDIRSPFISTHKAEIAVDTLAATSPSSLALKVLNPEGSIFMLLSGGGASVVILDEIASAGAIESVANYGEYSGNPSRQETYLYTKQVLGLMHDSPSERKVLLIAGGVANFTDIKKTFDGIIEAMSEDLDLLRDKSVSVVVRRGGPNERDGLAHMSRFLESQAIEHEVYDAKTSITAAVEATLDRIGITKNV